MAGGEEVGVGAGGGGGGVTELVVTVVEGGLTWALAGDATPKGTAIATTPARIEYCRNRRFVFNSVPFPSKGARAEGTLRPPV